MDDTLVERTPWLAVQLASGERLAPPGSGRLMLNPKADIDGSGRPHVVWAENDTLALPLRRRHSYDRATSLWYARYESGVGWRGARKVYGRLGDGNLTWGQDDAFGTFAVGDDGRGHVSVFGSDSAGHRLFGHILIDGDAPPYLTRLDSLGSGIQHGLIALGDTVYVTYSDRPEDLRPADGRFVWNNIQVFARRSIDAGRTWGPPVEVGRRVSGRTSWVTAFGDGTGVAHIVWAQGLEPDTRGEVIRHASLAPGGDRWSESEMLAPTQDFFGLRAVGDACGTVHIVYQAWQDHEVRLQYARLSPDGWSGPTSPFPGRQLTEYAMAADSTALTVFSLEAIPRDDAPEGNRQQFEFSPVLLRLPIEMTN